MTVLDDYEYCFRETIMWVKLHMGKEDYKEFDAELNRLQTSQLYTESQRRRIRESYEKHKTYFPELWQRQSVQETESVNNHSGSGS